MIRSFSSNVGPGLRTRAATLRLTSDRLPKRGVVASQRLVTVARRARFRFTPSQRGPRLGVPGRNSNAAPALPAVFEHGSTVGAVVYCLLVLAFFLGVWIYYDRRDHALFEAERRKLTFHCIRCGRLYIAKSGAGTAVCPQCGHTNARLRF